MLERVVNVRDNETDNSVTNILEIHCKIQGNKLRVKIQTWRLASGTPRGQRSSGQSPDRRDSPAPGSSYWHYGGKLVVVLFPNEIQSCVRVVTLTCTQP